MVSLTFPLLVAALGEAVSERAGVYNLGMEGYMLFGAYFGFYGALVGHSLWVGLIVGVVAGLILSVVHAYCSITLRINQIITGVALWLVGIGVTSFLHRSLTSGESKDVGTFTDVNFGALAKIPWLGDIIFQQNFLTYLGFVLVVVLAFVFKRTKFGVLNAATGDNPVAVDLAGHSVSRIRYASVLVCGAMCGLAGSYLSLGVLGTFSENMTSGKGFIAFCLVIFGKWDPKRVLLGALIFAGADALQARLQAVGLPVAFPFLLMIPYVLTLIVLVTAMRKGEAPTMLGEPYSRSEG